MSLIYLEKKGFGSLRKQPDRPVVVVTDSAYFYPPLPQRKGPDGNPLPYDCLTPTTVTGNDNEPMFQRDMIKHCFVGEDPVTKKVKPVTEYANRAAFMAEAVGLLDDQRRGVSEDTTAYREGVIRMWLPTPQIYGVNDYVGLDVDPSTGKLHLFRAVLGVPAAEAIGRPYQASTIPRNFVDVYFNL